jgi:hypothetical protein
MICLVFAFDYGEADLKSFKFTGGDTPGNPALTARVPIAIMSCISIV